MQLVRVLVLTIALALTAASAVHAQTTLRAGLTVGAATSTLGGDDFIGSSSRWGFIGGAFLAVRPSRSFSLSLEANYLQKGGDNVAFTVPPRNVSTSYLELPLTAGYVFQMTQGWEGRIYAGIDLAFLLSCNVSSSAGDSSCDDSLLVPSAKSTEWSVPFGVQVGYDFGGSALALDIRYSLGLTSTFETSSAGSNLKSRSWQFKLMWGFPIGGR